MFTCLYLKFCPIFCPSKVACNSNITSQLNSFQSLAPIYSLYLKQNRRWKLFCFDIDCGLNHILFRNKTFLFYKIENWNFQHLFEKFFLKLHNIPTHSAHSDTCYFYFSIGCLIELKFCEVSRNLFSNRCWKFQFSIL